jgi:predicted nucleic acid-binding protein
MSVERFLDTNVLLYHVDDGDVRKHSIATGIVRDALRTGGSCISWQVVQEFLNAAVHKAAIPLDHAGAEAYCNTVLIPLWAVIPSHSLYIRALGIRARYGFHFYDSLIVAAALEAGCTRLLTEDLQHGQRIETLIVENPFI